MLIQADARAIPLQDGCVQCVVTSPPYFGLRDYGIAQQIGLESTPDAYVAALVAVFEDVRRVLADDGVCWLNLGDSYASGGRKTRDPGQSKIHQAFFGASYRDGLRPDDPDGVKPKDLLMIPARVALALQADGWYLRSDVIWHKPNPMPESVTDRPTKSHEYLFLLTKSERYFYDQAAIYEPYAESTLREAEDGPTQFAGRNKRTVWTIPTMPYAGAHFATMPEALVTPCVLAGSRPGDLVFDPFSGSGTVLAVAQRLGRRAVGTDLNPAYHQLAKVRTAQRGLRW